MSVHLSLCFCASAIKISQTVVDEIMDGVLLDMGKHHLDFGVIVLQSFDVVGWVAGRASCLYNICAIYPQREPVDEENRQAQANSGLPGTLPLTCVER